MDNQPEDAFGGLQLDADSSGDEGPVLTSRERRILAAVQRSKTSYTSQQAYTEPGHYVQMISPLDGCAAYSRYAEHMAVQLYFAGEYKACLDLCHSNLEAGGSDRETVDLALRAALRAGEAGSVLDLVETSRQWWKGTPGLADTAAGVYQATGNFNNALAASLYCISERGLSSHPLGQLQTTLQEWRRRSNVTESELDALRLISNGCEYAAATPYQRADIRQGAADLGPVSNPAPSEEAELSAADVLFGSQDTEALQSLRGFFKKVDSLSRAGGDETQDRSVRTL